MIPRENIPVPLNEWFFSDGELTELGYDAITFSPNTDQMWELMKMDRTVENLPSFIKSCMEYALFDDGILNFLFPAMGAIVFRFAVENMMAAYSLWPYPSELILESERSLHITELDQPFIFYVDC